MKNLITLTLCMCLGLQTSFAQFEVVGSEEYGRLFDVTYDPILENTLYAVPIGNHIVTSGDNGQNWEILYSFPQPGTALEGLRYLEGNKLSFYNSYSSTGSLHILDLNSLTIINEYVLPVPPGSTDTWVASYDIFEANPDYAIIHQGYKIGTSNFAKVYYTTDGGDTFEEIYHNTDYDSVFPNNVVIHPTNPEIVFIARGNGPSGVDGGIFKSGDAGVTWEQQFIGNTFDAIAFDPQDANTMLLGTGIGYGDHVQNLYKSTDAGENWSIIPIDWNDQTLDNITVIKYNPYNPGNILILEENEIVITHDDFATWENHVYPDLDVHSYYYGLNASFNPFEQEEVFISSNYHVLFSEDGGETLSWAKNPYFTTTGNINYFTNNQESHLYYGVQFGYVHKDMQTLEENPYEIKPLDYVANSPGITVLTDSSIPGRVYSYEGGFMGHNLYVSNDHGENREQVFSGFSNNLHAVTSHPTNPSIIWASISSFGSDPQLMEIDFSDLNNIETTTITLPISDIVTGIYINPANPDARMLAVGATIFSTTDAGNTWEELNNGLETLVPFQDLILTLANNPLDENQFSIATNQGIFSTQNGGALWEQKTFSLVHNIAYSTETNGHLLATTHNSNTSSFGIMYSTDGGEEWNTVSEEEVYYVSSSTTAFQFFEESADVYIGTGDLGLVKYTIDLTTLNNPDFNSNTGFLKLYPNPVTDILNVDTGEDKITRLSIYTITGQNIMNVPGTHSLNLAALKSGVYFIEVTTGSGKKTTGKIVKK